MESLEFPIELCWNGKMEPDSPSSELFGLSSAEESWCFGDDFTNNILLPNLDVDDMFTKDINKTADILLEFEYENEQWLDVKNVQPMETSTYITEPQPNGYSEVQVVKLPNSELELEKFCDVSELTQLTPPQTPPQSQSFITETDIYDIISQQANVNSLTTKSVIEDIIRATSPATSYVDYSSDTTNSPRTSIPDAADIYIAQGSDIVDEILRTKAQDLPDCNDENSMYSNYSSGGVSLSTNDSEWTPSPAPSSSKCSDYDSPHNTSASSSSSSTLNGGVTKKRVRPYSRNVEDKKSRKKEQNKNAATRYRQKKKLEMEEVLEEERLLAIRNEELVRDANEIEREVKYLKKLIKEFYKAKYC